MIDSSAAAAGQEGQEVKRDLLDYVAGINQFIREARTDPTKLPAEYTALAIMPRDWRPTDTAAVASLIGGIFGKGGGFESRAGEALRAAYARFGRTRGEQGVQGLPLAERPRGAGHHAAALCLPRSQAPRDQAKDPPPRRAPWCAAGSTGAGWRCPTAARCATATRWCRAARPPRASRGSTPPYLRSLGKAFGGRQASNATLVRGGESKSGRPLGVTGPAGGLLLARDPVRARPARRRRGLPRRGVPGHQPLQPARPRQGLLLERDHRHHRQRGRVRGGAVRAERARAHAAVQALPLQGPLRADEGPAAHAAHARPLGGRHGRGGARHQARAAAHRARPGHAHGHAEGQAGGARQRALHLHARARLGAGVQAAEPQRGHRRARPSSARWARSTSSSTGSTTTSATSPTCSRAGSRCARAAPTPRCPPSARASHDWRRFDPATFTSARASFRQLPKDINPPRGYIVSWNNKQAPGWRAGDDVFSFNSVQRSERLEDRVRSAIRGPGQDRPAQARVDHGRRRHRRPPRAGGAPVAAAGDRAARATPPSGGCSRSSTAGGRAARTASTATATTSTRTRARSR